MILCACTEAYTYASTGRNVAYRQIRPTNISDTLMATPLPFDSRCCKSSLDSKHRGISCRVWYNHALSESTHLTGSTKITILVDSHPGNHHCVWPSWWEWSFHQTLYRYWVLLDGWNNLMVSKPMSAVEGMSLLTVSYILSWTVFVNVFADVIIITDYSVKGNSRSIGHLGFATYVQTNTGAMVNWNRLFMSILCLCNLFGIISSTPVVFMCVGLGSQTGHHTICFLF